MVEMKLVMPEAQIENQEFTIKEHRGILWDYRNILNTNASCFGYNFFSNH